MRTSYRVAIIGPAQTGKSSLLRALSPQKGDAENECASTIGIDTRFINATNVKIQVTDTAGSERFKSIRQACYKNVDLFVIVADNSDSNLLEKDIHAFLAEIKACGLTQPFKVGLIINFRDTLALRPEHVSLSDELRRNFEFIEKVSITEAKTGSSIRKKIIGYAEALALTRPALSRISSSLSHMSVEEVTPAPVRHGSNTSFSERIQQLMAQLPALPSAQGICHGFGRLFCCHKRSTTLTSENLEERLMPDSPRSGH